MLNILFLVNLPLLIVITDYKPPISLYILGSLNCYHSRLIPFLYHWWQFPLRLIQFPGETGDALNWCACSTLQSSNKSALSVTSVKMGSNLIMVSALLTADMVVKMERWGKQCMFQRTPFLPQLLLCHILDIYVKCSELKEFCAKFLLGHRRVWRSSTGELRSKLSSQRI